MVHSPGPGPGAPDRGARPFGREAPEAQESELTVTLQVFFGRGRGNFVWHLQKKTPGLNRYVLMFM